MTQSEFFKALFKWLWERDKKSVQTYIDQDGAPCHNLSADKECF